MQFLYIKPIKLKNIWIFQKKSVPLQEKQKIWKIEMKISSKSMLLQ